MKYLVFGGLFILIVLTIADVDQLSPTQQSARWNLFFSWLTIWAITLLVFIISD